MGGTGEDQRSTATLRRVGHTRRSGSGGVGLRRIGHAPMVRQLRVNFCAGGLILHDDGRGQELIEPPDLLSRIGDVEQCPAWCRGGDLVLVIDDAACVFLCPFAGLRGVDAVPVFKETPQRGGIDGLARQVLRDAGHVAGDHRGVDGPGGVAEQWEASVPHQLCTPVPLMSECEEHEVVLYTCQAAGRVRFCARSSTPGSVQSHCWGVCDGAQTRGLTAPWGGMAAVGQYGTAARTPERFCS